MTARPDKQLADRAQKHRAKMAQNSREQFSAVADIGEMPEVVDPARKDSCRLDMHAFLTTYFPASTGLKPFCQEQRDAITRFQQCALDGGLFLNAMPRGFVKTTIGENGILWVILYGHRKFPLIVGADADSATGNLDSIKMELETNDLLLADFPEVCHAIRKLEGKPQRCGSQTYQGSQTHIEWRADLIVLPTIPGSPASGTIVATSGILGGVRGMKHKRPDGTQQRPDLVLLDDPQTDESARTAVQVGKRLGVVRKSILRLGGHNGRIAGVMNATVIQPDDMVEQIMDPKQFPSWQCARVKMVKKFADAHETLWLGDYARIRNTYDQNVLGDQQRAHLAATDFYRRNRPAMDAGCIITWEHCFDDETEASAIQHAYNILIDDGQEVFDSECQNQPRRMKIEGEQEGVTPDEVAKRVNRLPRGVVPAEGNRLVCFIDVHDNVLYYEVAGLGEGFTGGVVDYGTWPEQPQPVFNQRSVKNTIAKKTGKKQFEEQLYAALDTLVNGLVARDWKREDGTILKPERILIDARDGDHAETVKLFCRRSPHAAVLLPSNGIYVGAKRQPLNERPAQTGERRGWHWRIEPKPGTRGILRFDTNAWKSRAQSFWRVPMGGKGCITLFGDSPDTHRMYGAHQAAEYGVRVTVGGRTVTEFQARPNQDNHLHDCHVGCLVAAGTLGVDVAGEQAIKRKRIKLSELRRQKQRAS